MTYISRGFQTLLMLALAAGMWWVFHSFVVAQIVLFGAVAVIGVLDIWKGKTNLFSTSKPAPTQTEGHIMGYDLDCE